MKRLATTPKEIEDIYNKWIVPFMLNQLKHKIKDSVKRGSKPKRLK